MKKIIHYVLLFWAL